MWNKIALSVVGRRRVRNIVTEQPGVKGEAKFLEEAGEIWKLFFTHTIIHQLYSIPMINVETYHWYCWVQKEWETECQKFFEDRWICTGNLSFSYE